MQTHPVVWHRARPPSPALELVQQGFQQRTVAAGPRLSEIVAEYRRIGFEVQLLPHQAQPGDCTVCFEDGGLGVAGAMDVFVRRPMA